MKGTEVGKDKVRKICEALRNETIEPAHVEAEGIVADATSRGEEIINQARVDAEELLRQARMEIEREKNVFDSSLNQACKQALESLKQQIENLFNEELSGQILKETQDPKVIAELIKAVITAITTKGIDTELSVSIPAVVPARSVNAFLAEEILQKLREKSVLLSSIGGGIEVKLHKDNITIDLSASAIKELVAKYIRKDFRQMIFKQGNIL